MKISISKEEYDQIKIDAKKTNNAKEKGKKTFHPKRINWSYL